LYPLQGYLVATSKLTVSSVLLHTKNSSNAYVNSEHKNKITVRNQVLNAKKVSNIYLNDTTTVHGAVGNVEAPAIFYK
jgi:hypothetical protein